MIEESLPYEEQHALESILRHHQIDPKSDEGKALAKDLAALGNWIHDYEHAKFDRNATPPLLLAFLSTRGIYGSDVLEH